MILGVICDAPMILYCSVFTEGLKDITIHRATFYDTKGTPLKPSDTYDTLHKS